MFGGQKQEGAASTSRGPWSMDQGYAPTAANAFSMRRHGSGRDPRAVRSLMCRCTSPRFLAGPPGRGVTPCVEFYLVLAAAIITVRSLIRRAWYTHRWGTRPASP